MEKMLDMEVATVKNFSKIVGYALDIGEMLEIYGAEVSRVEDTVSRICYAYGAVRVDVLTITSAIVLTVVPPEGDAITQTRRISGQSRDMTRIDELNRLSRDICQYLPPEDELKRRIDEIRKIKKPHWSYSMVASIFAGCGFTAFFGGSIRDVCAAVFVAVLIWAADRARSHIRINKIVYYLITSFIAGSLSVALVHIGIGENANATMIGTIMLLIPGLAITSALEDLLTGDTITGLLQFCESVVVAVVIAVGFAFSVFACSGYDMFNDGIKEITLYVKLAVSFAGSLGFAMMYGIRKPKRLAVAALGAVITELAYFLPILLGDVPMALRFFIAAVIGGAYAQIMARVMRVPATIFTAPTVITLIPGSALYYTMSWALRSDMAKFTEWGMTTLICALSIAFGLMIVLVLTGGITAIIRKIKIIRKR